MGSKVLITAGWYDPDAEGLSIAVDGMMFI
jgi:hypothetical protein